MALIRKQIWNPSTAEKHVLDHLDRLYENEATDAFVIHNFLMGTLLSEEAKIYPMKPDFVVLDPKRGIAVVEVKDWAEFKLEGNFAVLRNGSRELNPIVKGQNYFFNLTGLLKSKNVDIKKDQLKSHLVFTKLKSDPRLQAEYVTTHFTCFRESITLEGLFNNKEEVPKKLVDEALAVICPEMFFSRDRSDSELLTCGLDEKQSDLVSKSPYGHYLVSGIPGSGKSVMLASRAIFLNNTFPDWKILILSLNRNLVNQIEKDLRKRTEGREGVFKQNKIKCTTLKGFLESCCPPDHKHQLRQTQGYVNQVRFLREKATPVPQWDAVLIDEYQDFIDEDFSIILRSCKKHQAKINKEERFTENLFLSGDKLQQIWEEGCSHSWEKMGINIRGRSTILKTSYRSPSDITSVALEFLIRSGLADEVKQFYEGIDDVNHLLERKDSIRFDVGWDVEAARLHLGVQQAIASGASASEILIIAPTSKTAEVLKIIFKDEITRGLIIGTHQDVKGLESPYVFLYNIGAFDFSYRNSHKMKAKILYMCLTRASHFICITSFKDEGSVALIKDIAAAIRSRIKDVA